MANTHTIDTPPPPFVNSINELRNLSSALSTFLCRYDELKNHVNIIKSSIDSIVANHLVYTANPNQSTLTSVKETSCAHSVTVVPEAIVSKQNPKPTASNCGRSHDNVRKPEIPNSSKKHEEIKLEEIATCKKPEEIATTKKPQGIIKLEEINTSKKRPITELEKLCYMTSHRHIRKYVATHISDMNNLRKELPEALKFSKDPAKLVLNTIGRFYTQSTKGKAFADGSEACIGRLASVLILESFVMISSDVEITEEHEKSAAEATGEWKQRMISESELHTNEVDARGLLLLISGFGIPNHVFENKDIRDLIKASNVKEIAPALRRSTIFNRKIPEVIDFMVKSNMEIEAADLAYTLGLEDNCQPKTILTTFFQNKIKDVKHDSSDQIMHQLSDLKTLLECSESHNLDLLKLFPALKIEEKIQQLEKEMHEINSTATQKRKPEPKIQQLEKEKEIHEINLTASQKRKPEPKVQQLEKEIHKINSTTTQKRKAEPKVQEPKRSRVDMPHQQSPNCVAMPHQQSPNYPTFENGTGFSGSPVMNHLGQPYFPQPSMSQPYFPQPSMGQPFGSQPSTSVLSALYGGQPSPVLMEPFPRYVGPIRRSPVSDLYSFADKV